MKTFEQLTTVQREEAIKFAYKTIRNGITDGTLEVKLVDPKNQERLDNIIKYSVGQDNMRLANLLISKTIGVRTELSKLALVVASESDYDDEGQVIMEGTNAHAI